MNFIDFNHLKDLNFYGKSQKANLFSMLIYKIKNQINKYI